MAGLEVKKERRSETPLCIEEEESVLSPKPKPSPRPTAQVLVVPGALYKRQQETLSQQVEVEEQSVKLAMASFQDLKRRFQKYTNDVPHVTKLIESIDDLSSRKKECRVTAGVVGPTGLGKSTLLNAVLGMRELLPTDNGQACTSAIIEVLWNPEDDSASNFRATIVFLQATDWRSELEQLYKDSDALARKDAGDDDGIDFELVARFEAAMAKVRAVYPHIDHQNDLKKTSVAKLMTHENIQNLGRELFFTGRDREKFCSLIRPFIVSSTTNHKSASWPLVKIAKIYVKCEVLKAGLVLVDIPGSMDTNSARNALSQKYQRELGVSCILAPSKRAASDLAAQTNLSETYQRHLQLDGRWKSDNIIFIVVRTDESIAVRDHIKKNPLVAKRLVRVFAKENTWNENKASLQAEIDVMKDGIHKKLQVLGKLDSEIRSLFIDLKIMPKKMNRKRGKKLVEAVSALPGATEADKANVVKLAKFRDDRENIKNARNNDFRKQKYKEDQFRDMETLLERAECVKTRACIEHRSEVQTATIRAYFDRISRETGNEDSSQPLHVHCVSASKYLDFVDGSPLSLGFPKPCNTQIPQLQQTLASTTLGVRHRNAKVTLEEIEGLVHIIRSWARGINVNFQLGFDERQTLENMFEELADKALKSFSKLHNDTSNLLAKEIHAMFIDIRKIENKAALSAMDTVEGLLKLHFSTMRAIFRKRGEFHSSAKQITYSVNNDLAGHFMDDLMQSWTHFFDRKLPVFRRENLKAAQDILRDFSEGITSLAETVCPQMAELLESLGQSVLRLQPILQTHYIKAFDIKIAEARSNAHRLIAPQIMKLLTNVYQAAGAENGAGCKKRAHQLLKTHLKDNGNAMYKKCAKVLKNSLDEMVTMLKVDLYGASDDIDMQARELFQLMLESNTTIADPHSQQLLITAKDALLKDVSAVFDNLTLSLVENIRVPMDEGEEESSDYDVVAEPMLHDNDSDELDDDDMDIDDAESNNP